MSAKTVTAKKHVAGRLKHLSDRSAKELSLSKADTLDLFEAMRERVLETEKIERAAFTELSKIV